MSKVILFSGGGARGAFQAGVIKQLTDQGYKPDAVGGISVGALNGAMLATGRASRLPDVWLEISEEQVLSRRGLFRTGGSFLLHKMGLHKPPMGYFSNAPLEKLLRAHIGSSFVCDFYCGTVNLHTGKYTEHRARRMMVPWQHISAIMASTAIPLVFDPIRIGEHLHVDGGAKHMNPVGQMLDDYNPSDITIVTCNQYHKVPTEILRNPRDIVDVALYSLDALLTEIFVKDVREFIRLNHLVRQAQAAGVTLKRKNGQPYKEFTARLYEPDHDLGDSLNFGVEQARRNYQIGLDTSPEEI